MVNYKNQRVVEIAGIHSQIQFNFQVLHLTEQTVLATSADAMQKNSAVYQVPTGKQCVIKSVTVWTNASAVGTLAIYQADTEDATTSIKQTVDIPKIIDGSKYTIKLGSTKIAAGKFITIVPSATNIHHILMIATEESI